MKALVTGATGFVGAAVAGRCWRAQWQVRVLARRGSDRRNLGQSRCRSGRKAISTDFDSLAARSAGLRRIISCCRGLSIWARAIHRSCIATNVEGTRNILNAAHRAGVQRIVYTSSVATIGIPADGTPGR